VRLHFPLVLRGQMSGVQDEKDGTYVSVNRELGREISRESCHRETSFTQSRKLAIGARTRAPLSRKIRMQRKTRRIKIVLLSRSKDSHNRLL
jgi:hypothetical protein